MREINMVNPFDAETVVAMDRNHSIMDAGIAFGVTAAVYLIAPDILTKFQTVLFMGVIFFTVFAMAQYIHRKMDEVRRKRDGLKICQPKRGEKPVDFRPGGMRRKYFEISEKGMRTFYM